MEHKELLRAVSVFVCKDGTISFCDRGERPPIIESIPVFSVDTTSQARMIQTRFGKVQYNDHPRLPNQVWYRMFEFDGNIESLPAVGEQFRDFYYKFLTGEGNAKGEQK